MRSTAIHSIHVLAVLAGNVIMGSKLKEKSGRWTTAKDAPQPKGLTLIPENTEGGKKIFL
jgi:hypothetical protein